MLAGMESVHEGQKSAPLHSVDSGRHEDLSKPVSALLPARV